MTKLDKGRRDFFLSIQEQNGKGTIINVDTIQIGTTVYKICKDRATVEAVVNLYKQLAKIDLPVSTFGDFYIVQYESK